MKQRINRLLLPFFLTFCFSFTLFPEPVSAESANPDAILHNAELLFKEASEEVSSTKKTKLFLESAAAYQTLADKHVQNGELYYNLGNAYLRAGVIGKAILNYRKALLYSPGDRQLHHNLAYAREKQKNSFSSGGNNKILEIILFPLRTIPLGLSVFILIASSLILWASIIGRYFYFRIRPVITIPLIFIVLSTAVLGYSFYEYRKPQGVITAQSTIGRNGDSKGYEATFSEPLYEGVEFTIIENRAGWYLVRLNSGDITWIESQDCELVQ